MSSRDHIREGLGMRLGADQGGSPMGRPARTYAGTGIVGHEGGSPTFARIENSQILVEITVQPEGDEIVARVGDPNAGLDAAFHVPLRFGCRVALLFVDGEQNEAYVIARLHDEECSLPDSVAGVQTTYYVWDPNVAGDWRWYNQADGSKHPASWATAGQIPPFEGFYVRVTSGGESITAPPPAGYTKPSVPPPTTENAWSVQLTLSSVCRHLTFGPTPRSPIGSRCRGCGRTP